MITREVSIVWFEEPFHHDEVVHHKLEFWEIVVFLMLVLITSFVRNEVGENQYITFDKPN